MVKRMIKVWRMERSKERAEMRRYERKLDERERFRELENKIRKINLERDGMMRKIDSLNAENENNSQELGRSR